VSLRRRITGAVAIAVAAVAVGLSVTGYLSTRSHLLGQLRSELQSRAAPFLQPHNDSGKPGGQDRGGAGGFFGGGRGNGIPASPPLGGAPGYFESIYPSGRVVAGDGRSPELPVDAAVLKIARRASGSFYRSATVRGIHVEVLTIGDRYDHKAVEVALPLTSVDSVLNGLLLTYGLLIAGGVVLAGLLGALIARAAVAPIERFSEKTEQVTSALDRPRRLEETGAAELRRLAGSFNETLDALERSIAAQRHLIADASHELRTPMAALRSNIQIFLEAHRLPPQEREELQEAIVAELDELTQLVADVLELARGTTPSEHTESLELDVIVRDAVARAQRRAAQMDFHLELEPTVIINSPDRISRAVTNLIDNARKWSLPDGIVEVTLHDGELTVRDHGPGFKAADLEHVFDRFYRADEARRMSGSGLGLAIVKQAAEAHGGAATAANAPDGGAILRVSFAPAGLTPSRAREARGATSAGR
jgi:two-component system sensor histidine kinase MprB